MKAATSSGSRGRRWHISAQRKLGAVQSENRAQDNTKTSTHLALSVEFFHYRWLLSQPTQCCTLGLMRGSPFNPHPGA